MLALLAMAAAVSAEAGEVVFESKPTRTHLIELYTSEGCSSCLPAEAWMSALKNEARLWQEFVPVAFHVDYWDHLGWRDPLALPKWTERQTEYSTRWKKESVYTPAFALDGQEWFQGALTPATDPAGVLKLVVNGDRVIVSFKPAQEGGARYDIHLARLAFAVGNDVTAGENNGRKLMHDFVVVGLTNESMKGATKELKLAAPAIKPNADPRSALAAWVTLAGQLEPVQATGGWLP